MKSADVVRLGILQANTHAFVPASSDSEDAIRFPRASVRKVMDDYVKSFGASSASFWTLRRFMPEGTSRHCATEGLAREYVWQKKTNDLVRLFRRSPRDNNEDHSVSNS